MEKKQIVISEEYLKQLVDYCSRSCVGKIMKRMEILTDINAIKLESKELVYESFRQFRELLQAYQVGKEITSFTFKNPTSSIEKK